MRNNADKLLISGIAAYRHAPPPPAVQRRVASRVAFEAHMLLLSDPARAEPALRHAIELLVDAFLLDRTENADCFARAHRLGAEVERRFGCRSHRDEQGNWVNDCGVLALHSRLGQSVGGIIHTECSICRAGAFECEHVEDEEYDGQRCVHIVQQWDVAEVSLTPRPRDPRWYRMNSPQTTAQVERELGRRLHHGETPVCHHCPHCYGRAGPNKQDLHPSRFPNLPVDERPTEV
jgi:hypothetical protein